MDSGKWTLANEQWQNGLVADGHWQAHGELALARGRWNIGNGKDVWQVGTGKGAKGQMASGYWQVVKGKWAMANGQRQMSSGKRSMANGQ